MLPDMNSLYGENTSGYPHGAHENLGKDGGFSMMSGGMPNRHSGLIDPGYDKLLIPQSGYPRYPWSQYQPTHPGLELPTEYSAQQTPQQAFDANYPLYRYYNPMPHTGYGNQYPGPQMPGYMDFPYKTMGQLPYNNPYWDIPQHPLQAAPPYQPNTNQYAMPPYGMNNHQMPAAYGGFRKPYLPTGFDTPNDMGRLSLFMPDQVSEWYLDYMRNRKFEGLVQAPRPFYLEFVGDENTVQNQQILRDYPLVPSKVMKEIVDELTSDYFRRFTEFQKESGVSDRLFSGPGLGQAIQQNQEQRQARLERFRKKREGRRWVKKINYECRKQVADTRFRYKGRFVTKTKTQEPVKPKDLTE